MLMKYTSAAWCACTDGPALGWVNAEACFVGAMTGVRKRRIANAQEAGGQAAVQDWWCRPASDWDDGACHLQRVRGQQALYRDRGISTEVMALR